MQKQCWSLARIVGSYNFSWSICPISDNDQRWEKKSKIQSVQVSASAVAILDEQLTKELMPEKKKHMVVG